MQRLIPLLLNDTLLKLAIFLVASYILTESCDYTVLSTVVGCLCFREWWKECRQNVSSLSLYWIWCIPHSWAMCYVSFFAYHYYLYY